jgi:hypothetical protein
MSPTPSRDKSQWPTLTQAAARLGSNERTIRRWIESGRLKASTRTKPGSKPITIIDPGGIEQLRLERLPPVVLQDDTVHPDSTALVHAPGSMAPAVTVDEHFARLIETIVRAREADAKPWLTLEEASVYSGLTRKWLLEQTASPKRVVAVRDMGKYARGGRWRFNRKDLEKA